MHAHIKHGQRERASQWEKSNAQENNSLEKAAPYGRATY